MAQPRVFVSVGAPFLALLLVTGLAAFQQETEPGAKQFSSKSFEPKSNERSAHLSHDGEIEKPSSRDITATGTLTLQFKARPAVFNTKLYWNPARPTPTPVPEPASQAPAESAAELAKKLANPVASLISVPFQYNYDYNVGPGGRGSRSTLIIQPVIPFKLSANWNLISRTIVPIIHQSNVTAPGAGETGVGDTTQSLFFSPSRSEPFIWAVGPVLVIPTATNSNLGLGQLGLGPTFLILKQQKGLTFGALVNHAVRVAGSTSKPKLNNTFLQPILSYGTKTGWTYGLTMESSYDWTAKQWSVPIGPSVSKLVRFGKKPVSFAGALRCWAARAPNSANNCSFRFTTTLLFPA